MDILHLSDLHPTDEHADLRAAWVGPASALGDRSFDFIVVSGDLSQSAAGHEYAALRSFTELNLLPLLRSPERKRIVFVPGNHDIDWSCAIAQPVDLVDTSPPVLAQAMRELKTPWKFRYRQAFNDVGLWGLFQTHDRSKYCERLKEVHGFLKDFYGGELDGDPNHAFDLLRGDGSDYSVHAFPAEKVAFFGLNSCDANDRYWRGASFNDAALTNAAEHARRHFKDWLLVAVWHHGLASERGSPDHLTPLDIGTLYNAGFRIGFHGHTHRAAVETVRVAQTVSVMDDQFVVLATGSLGAGSRDRPDAAGNQFSIVQLEPHVAAVELFEREGSYGVYRPRSLPRKVALRSHHAPGLPWARRQTRTWRINEVGIADVEVTLEGLRSQSPVVLALPTLRHSGWVGGRAAETEYGTQAVRVEEIGKDRYRILFEPTPDREYKGLKWRYRVSNAVATSAPQLGLQRRERDVPNLEDNEDCIGHVIRVDCRELILKVEFVPGSFESGSARLVTEHLEGSQGKIAWEVVDQRRLKDAELVEGVSIRQPRPGDRYSIAFRPAKLGDGYPEAAARLGQEIAMAYRDYPRDTSELATKMETGLVRALGEEVPKRADRWRLVCFAWTCKQRLLVPIWGRFPARSWNTKFAAGEGVAGHCFLFCRPAVWCEDGGTSVIFRERRGLGPRPSWILTLPLSISSAGPAIGVVSLSGGTESNFERKLRSICQDLASDQPSADSQQIQNHLISAANAIFWALLLDQGSSPLDPEKQKIAQRMGQWALERPAS